MIKYVKLPNDAITGVDENNFIVVKVEMELSTFIDNDFEGVLNRLSEAATGTELLSNISYSVTGCRGDVLEVKVTGSIESIEDIADVELDDLPMVEFEVTVTRVGYGCRTVRLSARTAEEAQNIADDDAGNHTYSEHQSDYEFHVRKVD